MAVAVKGSIESYHEPEPWWTDACHNNKISYERRSQLAAEMEAAFRTRCSAFHLATMDMIRRQCENCLTEAVDDALQRYSVVLHEALQLNNCNENESDASSSNEVINDMNIKVEESVSNAQIAENGGKVNNDDDQMMNQNRMITAPEFNEFKDVPNPYAVSEGLKTEIFEEKEFLPENTNVGNFMMETNSLVGNSSFSAGLVNRCIPPLDTEGKQSISEADDGLNYKVDTEYPSMVSQSFTVSHTSSSRHMCEQCGRGFSRKSHLLRHRLVHTGERPFHCHMCHRRFSQKVHLTVHMCTHNRSTSTCGTGQISQSVPDSSPAGIPNSFPSMWPPTMLPSMESTPVQPQGPAIPVIPSMQRQHVCGDCGKSFTRSSHLSRHRLIHTGERPHVCEICRKAFSQKVHLQAHLRRQHQSSQPDDCHDNPGQMQQW